MANYRSRIVGGVAAGALAVASLTACGSGSDASTTGKKGGTITLLDAQGNYAGTDPASVYIGEQLADFRRIVYRGLTSFPISTDDKVSGTVQPDLATSTGTASNGGKDWTYTIKKGLKWQDGSPITPQDFAYGLSRSFDSTLVNSTGVGTTYLAPFNLGGLFKADGTTDYPGPLTATPAQQKEFDTKAYTINGDSITYHFAKAWTAFPQAAALLFTFDPYEKKFETGTKGLWKVNSDGPYILQPGTSYDANKGGTFVRNPNYDPKTDSTDLRRAYPDTIKWTLLGTVGAIFDRLIANAGDDQTAYSAQDIDPAHYGQVDSVSDRAVVATSPYTAFLEINALRVKNPKIRRALILATDKNGWITAKGGVHWGKPSSTVVADSIPGYQPNPSTKDDNPAGDPVAAKKLLTEANAVGYPITFAFTDTPSYQKAAAVEKTAWEAAGFKVTLDPISLDAKPSYFGQMSQKVKNVDVFRMGWASDFPSLLGVIPPILQSNPPTATSGVGFNYGFYSNAAVDAQIAKAQASTDSATQIAALQKADELAEADGAYIPLAQQGNWFLHGSKVGGFISDVASSNYPDLGAVFVK